MSDNRPPVYWEGDVLVIRASAIGTTCLWELVAAGQGHEMGPVPDGLQRAYDEGTKLEPVVLAKYKEVTHEVYLSHQEEDHLDITPTTIVRFHPDAETEDDIVEAKAITNDSWHQAVRNGVGSLYAEYPWQLSVMMHAKGKRGKWVAYNKGTPPINDMGDRELCVDEGRIYIQNVPEPPIPLADIVAKALQIRELVEGPDVLESGRPCDDPSHYPCRYLHIRPEPEEKASVVEVSGEDASVLDSLTREYLTYKGMADEANDRLDKAKKAIIEIAGEDVSRLITDRFIIPVMNGRGSSRLAVDEMNERDREDYDRLCRKYMRPGKKYRYLRGVKGRE